MITVWLIVAGHVFSVSWLVSSNPYNVELLTSRQRREIIGQGQAQVAQARNMSIGEHRHCCVTFKI